MHRRTLLTGGGAVLVAATFAQTENARAQPTPVGNRDSEFMNFALEQAKTGDRPFGAAIVREEKVLAFGRDSTKRNSDPTAHAVMVAIRDFLKGHEPETFKDTTIYTTAEPCAMSMGAILWCGIPRLVYAASIKDLSKLMPQINISSAYVAGQASFADIDISGGLLSGNALRLFE
jgi:tRNA(Arg) A34 adenosine deaminase TadA